MFRSLRWRLLAWHAGILVLTVAGFGAALYYRIRQVRLGEVDAELQAAARTLEGILALPPPPPRDDVFGPPPFRDRPPPRPDDMDRPPPRDRPDPRHDRHLERVLTLPASHRGDVDAPLYFVVWQGGGEVFKVSNLPPEFVVPPYDPRTAGEPGRLELRQRGEFREAVVSGPRRTQVLVGRSVRREMGELTGLAWQLALTGAGVLVVGLAGGLLLSGRAVRPIERMSATAASISATNLNRRIDLKGVDSELGELATVLNDMFARLEAAFERQTRFTADASHELRTPLTVIHSNAELALSRPRAPEEYQETLDTCVRASRRMKSVIEGLLILARADAGKLALRRQPLDLGELVRDAAQLLEPLAAKKGVALSVQAPPLKTTGDAGRLSQVVTNLVSNAINYNRTGGRVSVVLSGDGREAILTVADTGCGIPEADRPHIFERFYRVDKARSREQGGNGLGLAICKSIVEGLGGSIGFTSEVDRGTTFVVRLPLAVSSESGVRRSESRTKTPGSPG